MFITDDFSIWNLQPGQTVVVGAQSLFNVVGRLNDPEHVQKFSYRLNQHKEGGVHFNQQAHILGRLERCGDFNLDTIRLEDLQPVNELVLVVEREGQTRRWELSFSVRRFEGAGPRFSLSLLGVNEPQEVGQIVDGRWQIEPGRRAAPCIAVLPADAGYDRIILFGSSQWTSGYQVKACVEVTAWTHRVHLLGILFKWQAHLQGDGRVLPKNWNTGLGIFDSRSDSLRIRYGKNVHVENNQKIGDSLLGEAPLQVDRRNKVARVLRRLLLPASPVNHLRLNRLYWFHLVVHPEVHSLAVWPEGARKPVAQLIVPNPAEHLDAGSVGFIAYNCAVRLYTFDVSPYES